jgi:protein LTV1
MSKLNKRKVVTFQLVSRSVEDPNNADPNASEHVLVPIHIGKDVDPELVESLKRQMTPEQKSRSGLKKKKKSSEENRGIGARYNKYFDESLPDDGEDYSKYFKAIDEHDDDGVFIAPDGSVHDLREKKVHNVDALVDKLGFTKDLFGTEVDPSLPKLIDDTFDPLASGIDPEILLAMDDDDAPPLDDDFFSKALEAENEYDDYEEDGEDDLDSVDGFDESGRSVSKAMSRVSATPSHMSHISNRSYAMNMQEQSVDYIIENIFKEEEDYSDEERDMGTPTNWDEIAEDMDSFDLRIKLNPVPKPAEGAVMQVEEEEENAEEEEEEEEEERPKPVPLDIRSVTDFASTTDNLPFKIQDKSLAKKKKQKKQEEEEVIEAPIPPDFQPKPGETKEEAKARKKAIKEYQRQKRALKKQRKEKFAKATKKIQKSIAATGITRGQRVYNLN